MCKVLLTASPATAKLSISACVTERPPEKTISKKKAILESTDRLPDESFAKLLTILNNEVIALLCSNNDQTINISASDGMNVSRSLRNVSCCVNH